MAISDRVQSGVSDLKGAPSSETKEAAKDLSEDLAQLREDFKALRKDLSALTASGAEDAKEILKEKISLAEAKTHEAAEAAASEYAQLQKQAERAVRKNPLAIVAAALAIGYFFGGVRK